SAPPDTNPKLPTITQRVGDVLEALQSSAQARQVEGALDEILDEQLFRIDPKSTADLEFTCAARRLASHIRLINNAEASAAAVKTLQAHPAVADAMAWAVDTRLDDVPAAYRVLAELSAKYDAKLDRYATLVAALCIVHDKPRKGGDKPPTPAELFDYFVTNERAMMMPIAGGSTELLTHIVDSTASIQELAWALPLHKRDDRIGTHYFDVIYDTQALTTGMPKKIEGRPYTLQNLLKYGGVCVEQAYYAEHIAKAIGVPSATVLGVDSTVGHAWVGYMHFGTRNVWDFKEGRYDDYKGLRGNVRDPRTGHYVSDGFIAMRAEGAKLGPAPFKKAAALADAAQHLRDRNKDATGIRANLPKPAFVLELAANACPFSTGTWEIAAEWSKAGDLDAGALERWCQAVVRLCGDKYPDFAFETLQPLIDSSKDPAARDRLWAWARKNLLDTVRDPKYFRADLAALMLIDCGDSWRAAGDLNKAWQRYDRVVLDNANEGPEMFDATRKCEALLVEGGKTPAQIADYLRVVWSRIKKPTGMASNFMVGSNWFRVGNLYAAWLTKAGQKKDADTLRALLNPSATGK
ncbi:MAG: hypothetical protein AABZ53_09105, partial [Planctomycetota bacterium]